MTQGVFEIKKLAEAKGTSEKMKVLRESMDDLDFRNLLFYALNPMISYKVSENTLNSDFEVDPRITITFTDFYQVCDALSRRKGVDDILLYQVKAFLHLVKDREESNIYKKILSKTLRLGVTAKTVNKVIPGLIPEWEVQQAFPMEKYPVRPGTWFAITQKLNGVRATYYKGKLYARSGIPFTGLDHIIKDLKISEDDSLVFDGELMLRDKNGLSDNEAFRKAYGILNSDGDKTGICFTIFDVITSSDLERGKSLSSYRDRRYILDAIAPSLRKSSDGKNVDVLDALYIGYDVSMIQTLLDIVSSEDKEGLMVNLDTPYLCRRNNGILKVKRFYTMDLQVLGYEEGNGRLSGTLGALLLNFDGNVVKVGSGFSDEERFRIWEQKENVLGKICEVKYKEVSFDKKTGAKSLQFPVFVAIRTDKDDQNIE